MVILSTHKHSFIFMCELNFENYDETRGRNRLLRRGGERQRTKYVVTHGPERHMSEIDKDPKSFAEEENGQRK